MIQHVTGSKANKIETFSIENFSELTIGRDPSSVISYDPVRDDIVSRHHALIRISRGSEVRITIEDSGSSHGTTVNGEPVTGAVELISGDTIELGRGGPKFLFDVQPPLPNMIKRTRILAGGTEVGATRALDIAALEAEALSAVGEAPAGAKASIGRNTLMFELSKQRKESNRSWMYVLAALVVCVGAGGGYVYYSNQLKMQVLGTESERKLQQLQAAAKAEADAKANALDALRAKIGISSDELHKKYGNATVFISFQWRLYHKSSGKPLFHLMRSYTIDGKRLTLPCFVDIGSGVVRWLTTEDDQQANIPIAAGGVGTGFVISERGDILTNKHVAYGWLTGGYGQNEPFWASDANKPPSLGWVFKLGDNNKPTITQINGIAGLYSWTPGTQSAVFHSQAPIPIDGKLHETSGRNDFINVKFPGSPTGTEAVLARYSSVADVALIKIDTAQSLSHVTLATDDEAAVGERVTVLGYPGFSTKTVALVRSSEVGKVGQTEQQHIPFPTVTAGEISLKSEGARQQGDHMTIGRMGEVYQLTVPSGAGNSGGPVFNKHGKVIGIFTYGTARENVTYAVPIKFGRELLQVQRTN